MGVTDSSVFKPIASQVLSLSQKFEKVAPQWYDRKLMWIYGLVRGGLIARMLVMDASIFGLIIFAGHFQFELILNRYKRFRKCRMHSLQVRKISVSKSGNVITTVTRK